MRHFAVNLDGNFKPSGKVLFILLKRNSKLDDPQFHNN